LIALLLIILLSVSAFAYDVPEDSYSGPPLVEKDPTRYVAVANPNNQNRVHRRSNMWMNITNWGFFGNYFINSTADNPMDDPEYPGTYAPQCEFPAGSDVMYLYQGALWVGALVQEEGYEFPRVSVGTGGWQYPRVNEFYPGEGAENGIQELSNRPNQWNRLGEFVTSQEAVSEQDFVLSYSDTLTDPIFVRNSLVDGPHYPLGIKISQKSYSWTYNYAQDFIIIDFKIENIADRYLKNLYIGLYIDADVGWIGETPHWFEDDICGFQRYYYYTRNDGNPDSVLIDVAYIADNDGRPYESASGNDFASPCVSGTRVVRAPNPRLKTAFNWWISNTDVNLDFGPSWEDDQSGGWTYNYGTPLGDERKYFVLSNKEFDYDQLNVDNADWIESNPQHLVYRNPASGELVEEYHDWKIVDDNELAADLADGYDTRYLLSWGPLGVFDHTDEAGNDIFRLNPGEQFNMTIAYVAGEAFHDVNNPQSSNTNIDFDKFNFADLKYNAAWAAWVYDNPMIDTYLYDYGDDHDPATLDEDGSQDDGILDTGDGWYGEDTGTDGLYAILPPGVDSVEVYYFGDFMGWYSGPDEDGTELNGRLDPGEDDWEGPEFVDAGKYGIMDLGFMRQNEIFNAGDGIPDFQGPPPPNVPGLRYELTETEVILKWDKNDSEDPTYRDPFSQRQDFEGYRLYVSDSGLENDFALLAEFDHVNFAYFTPSDSMATYPDNRTDAPADTVIDGVFLLRKPVGLNSGMLDIIETDSTYAFVVYDARSLFPRWYSVTSFDYGDPKTGTEPLSTATTANAVYVAPSGSPEKEVIVVPNPYRAYEDYTTVYSGGLSWENQDDGTPAFFPNVDRRLEFINLPQQCLIRIYTVAGDLVDTVPHNIAGDDNIGWESDFSESWDLNSRNMQQVVSGIYLFSVEDYTPGSKGKISTGKFVVIR